MRMFKNWVEAQNELRRDLAELGQQVHPETMQDKDIRDDPDFDTRELTNYIYTVLDPDFTQIEGTHDQWVEAEWDDRVAGGLNPGHAWKTRKEVWNEFLERSGSPKIVGEGPGQFAYTYSMRMGGKHMELIIDELKKNPHSRQLYLPVWGSTDEQRRGRRRVPCSLGYWFVQRNGAVNLTYMMRSCDFATHFPNDVALACIMQAWIAKETNYEIGTFTHFIGSFHVYAKDVADVF